VKSKGENYKVWSSSYKDYRIGRKFAINTQKTKRILAYNKVQMLYLFKSKQVETVREVSAFLGKSEATIHRWLSQYKEGGLENLLKNLPVFGRPKKFSVEIAASLQQ
jgi:hypothetical protein